MHTSIRTPTPLLAMLMAWTLLGAPSELRAQGILVDEGTFRVSIAGRPVGTEEFSIRRAGIGRDDAMFANGVIVLGSGANRREITPLLRATPPDGVVAGYQVRVVGRDELDFQMTLAGRRYVAVVRSSMGDEDREFAARETTRVLDLDVAHHYYFLHEARDGDRFHVIEPRSRSQTTVTVERRAEDRLRLDGRTVEARRVELRAGEETRVVWFDRLGRVLRVEIPALGYVAERTDLVG